jgi:transposase
MEDWVGPEHPVRFVADLVDSLDLSGLGFEMLSAGVEGRPGFAPELLLGVWLYGWMERIRSTRALEKALHTQVAFMWLAGMEKPDHVTLWRFFDANHEPLRKLFKLVISTAGKAGLVGFALHALDGTKLAAACSMETAQHRKALQEELKKLDAHVDAGIAEVKNNEKAVAPTWKMPEPLRDPAKRKKEIQAALAELNAAAASHRHPTEPEAKTVKTREGIKLGYNAQIVVDHDSDLIVAADVVTSQTDHDQLTPMIEAVAENLGRPADETVADKGYWSGAQLLEAERRHLPVLVPAQEPSDKSDYAKSKFSFDAERDVYVCPRGVELPLEGLKKESGGMEAHRLYRCHDDACPVRSTCTEDKKGRTVKRFAGDEALARQAVKLQRRENQVLWSLRKEIVEHLFGIVKSIDGFRRFTVRGLEGAKAQWALACLAVNLRKLLPAVRDGRLRAAAFG